MKKIFKWTLFAKDLSLVAKAFGANRPPAASKDRKQRKAGI